MTQCKNCDHDLTGPDQKIFCSKSCAASFNNRGKKRNFRNRKCDECGNPVRSNRKYCRIICRKQGQEKPTRLCSFCGHDLKGNRVLFCSNECRYSDRKQRFLVLLDQGIPNPDPKRLKRHLVAIHGNRCMSPDCAWDFSKKTTVIEVDHVDGDSENNSLNNLRLLCPNCHSQTDTYKGKNRGRGRFKRRQRYHAGLSF